jgi:hypothetical protein
MLNSREWNDGRYYFKLIPIEQVGYVIRLDDKYRNDYNMKQYFTKDDESAIVVFDAMMECYEREGEEALSLFDAKARLGPHYGGYLEVNVE